MVREGEKSPGKMGKDAGNLPDVEFGLTQIHRKNRSVRRQQARPSPGEKG